MSWIFCGLILFAFASPSAVIGVPYAIGTQGYILGIVLCVLYTVSTALGSILLLDLAARYQARDFQELGEKIFGKWGSFFAGIIQHGNFLLFLPVALDIVASAAQGAIDPSFSICEDYFILVVAVVCLATTQIRSFSNAEILSAVSLLCVLGVGVVMVAIALTHDNHDKEDAWLVGNPSKDTGKGVAKGILGVTTAVWGYVPSFLVVELFQDVLTDKAAMARAVRLSAALNITFFVAIGVVVVSRWGWEMEDPVTLLDVWPAHSWPARLMSGLVLVANLISYALDSVAITRKYQQYLRPTFDIQDWSYSACVQFFSLSLPPWFFGLVLAIVTPNMFMILAYVTAFTVPWVTMIFPAVCTLRDTQPPLHQQSQPVDTIATGLLPSKYAHLVGTDPSTSGERLLGVSESRRIAYWLLGLGILTFLICLAAAIGKSVYDELRGDSIIGCSKWLLLDTSRDD